MVIELDLKKVLLFLLISYGVLVIFSILDSIVEFIVVRFGCLGVLAIWITGVPFVYWLLTGKIILLTILFSLFKSAVIIFFACFPIIMYILYYKRKKREKEVDKIIEEHKANR